MSLTLANQWQTDITDAYIGDLKLFKHSFKWLEINAGFSGIGLTAEDFKVVADEIQKADLSQTIECSDSDCIGSQACAEYEKTLPKLKFTISNKFEYEVGPEKLLEDFLDEKDDDTVKKCQINLYNSGEIYRLGDTFLKDYYTVFDIDKYKMGLGRLKHKEIPVPAVSPEDTDSSNSGSQIPDGKDSNYASFGELVCYGVFCILFTAMLVYCMKKYMFPNDARGGRALPIMDPNTRQSLVSQGDQEDKDEESDED